MKKSFIFLVLLLLFLQHITPVSAEENISEVSNVKIIVNGICASHTASALVVNNRTLLPYREFLGILGISNDVEHILWNDIDNSLTIKSHGKVIELMVDSPVAKIDGNEVPLDVVPVVYRNSVYIPIRFTAEALGRKVVWDGSTVAIFIADTEKFFAVKSILNSCNEAMKTITSLKTSLDMNMLLSGTSNGCGFSVDISSQGTSLYDAVSNTSRTIMSTNVADYGLITEEYCVDNVQYIKDLSTDVWNKNLLTPELFNSYVRSYTNMQITGNANEAFYAGLEINKMLSDDSTLVLSGNSFSDILFSQADKKASSILKGSLISSFVTDIYIDRSTNYITKVKFFFMGSDTLNGSPLGYSASISMSFGDFNSLVPIVLPDEAKNIGM